MRFGISRAMAVAAVVPVMLVSALTLSGPAKATGKFCVTGSSDGNTLTCIYVNGSGSFVNYMQASADTVNSGRVLQACLHNPSNGRIGCTKFTYVAPDSPPLTYTWAPHNYVTSGYYCTVTWRQNNDGSTTQIGGSCLLVQ
jgi:hypothetical protein